MTRSFTLILLLSLAGACARDYDPCPAGSMKLPPEDRCVAIQDIGLDATVPAEAADGSTPMPPMKPTADAAPIDPMDAAVDGAAPMEHEASTPPLTDAQMPDSQVPDARVPDAQHDGSILGPRDAGESRDAANTADGSTPSVCTTHDVEAWRTFHLSARLTAAIRECFEADPTCLMGSCSLDVCLQGKAGVDACNECVSRETECVATQCLGPCGSSGTDAKCRACACAKGCTTTFDTCAGSNLDVCADCNGTTCTQMSVLPPEQVMVILDLVLFGGLP